MNEIRSYRDRIYLLRLSRRILADRLNLKYTTFNNKLCEFSPWSPDQEKALREILDNAEQAQREIASHPDPLERRNFVS